MEKVAGATDRALELLQKFGPKPGSSIPEMRDQFDTLTEQFNVRKDVRISRTLIGGKPAYWVEPVNMTSGPVLLFLHGGGYMLGSARGFVGVASAFAISSYARILVLDYRLAPEHPCPAALDDALAAYEALVARGQPAVEIGIVGASAGGGLAMALLSTLRERGFPMPGAASLISPWLDLACSGESMTDRSASDPVLSAEALRGMAAAFLQGASVPPAFNPLVSDLSGLPPVLIQVGSREVLLDDAIRLAARAARSELEVTLKVWPRMIHDWPLFSHLSGDGCRAIDFSSAFFRQHLRF